MIKQKSALEFMQDPDSWSQWPRLPLKRRPASGVGWEAAYLIDTGPIITIYFGNMWLNERPSASQDFASYQEILDAGWVID